MNLQDIKTIYGKTIRTNNTTPEEIGVFWQEILKNKRKGEIFAIYHNYESDATGDYDLTIGYVNEYEDTFPVAIAETDYLMIPVEGKEADAVVKTWQHIWQMPLDRTYQTDFEVHQKDGSVVIYLGVK